jgi:hypothetical protein
MFNYLIPWVGIGMITTMIVANKRGANGAALILWAVLGAVLGIFAVLLAFASSENTSGGDRAFRLTSKSDSEPVAPIAPPPTLPAAAWYADPTVSGRLRYWDGTRWTQHVSAAPQPVA